MELLRCKIHRIYSVRTDISPSGDLSVRSPRGLADSTPQNACGVWGKCSPIVAKNATAPFFKSFFYHINPSISLEINVSGVEV